ncbi:MAG: T9SS type A sorting domain-containing protein [Melioribacteraceae bacterium]
MFLIIIFSVIELNAEGEESKKASSLNKTNGKPSRTHFNINNISTWIYNNGDTDIGPNGNSGFVYPKGSGKAAMFESGLVWGAKIKGEVRVGGSTYNQGLLPGRIDESGNREDTSLASVRIYRVRPDWKTGDLSAEVNDGEGTRQEVKDQYEKDWNEWPANYGAPFVDVDKDGSYNPTVDVPGVDGADQTIWYVANDFDPATTRGLYGSDPMGIEMQATFWGYNREGALGNTMFRKYKLINKSPDNFDSMFVTMWADPDLGGAGDDYVGCDVDLSLMYCYNGDSEDNQYGKNVPSIGFDFLQGPIVPGSPDDFAVFDGKIKKGFRNLEISAHSFFIGSDAVYSDPTLGDHAKGTLHFWNLMRGRISTTGQQFTSPKNNEVTKFALSGDPIKKTGWIDGMLHPPGDRRQLMTVGPFTLSAGETQEVVLAEIIAGGTEGIDRLQSLSILRSYDKEIQSLYLNLFQLPPKLSEPNVVVSSLDEEIVLSWGTDETERKNIEEYDTLGYTFQGYVVYQFPTAEFKIEEAIPIATYDLIDGIEKVVVTKFDAEEGIFNNKLKFRGTDSGIKRFISVNRDTLNSSSYLYNGSEYYFAVSSYAVSSKASVHPNFIESSILPITIIPEQEKLGSELASFGDTIIVTHDKGFSSGKINAIVIQPDKLSGHDYEITFEIVDSGMVYDPRRRREYLRFNVAAWNLKDLNTGKFIITKSTNYRGDDSSPIVNGLQIRVSSVPKDFKAFQVVANANGTINPPEGGAFDFNSFPTLRPTDQQQVGSGKWAFHTGDNGSRGSYSAFLVRSIRGSNFDILVPFDWEMRFTERGSWAVRAFEDGKILQVPFELWNIGSNTPDDKSDDYRLIPWFLSSGGVGTLQTDPTGMTWQLDPNDHSGSGGTNDPYTPWIYWRIPAETTPGEVGYNAYEESINKVALTDGTYAYDGAEVMARTVLISWNGDDVSDGSIAEGTQMVPEQGTVFRFLTTKPHSPLDVFSFTSPVVVYSIEKAKEDVKKINVFPNPYYATQRNETNRFNHFVTFNHLPNQATIRIYNLAGHRIRKIEKDDASQFLRWNLLNEHNFQVASGMYIVYIDMPDLNETKILKLAIITETTVPLRF